MENTSGTIFIKGKCLSENLIQVFVRMELYGTVWQKQRWKNKTDVFEFALIQPIESFKGFLMNINF